MTQIFNRNTYRALFAGNLRAFNVSSGSILGSDSSEEFSYTDSKNMFDVAGLFERLRYYNYVGVALKRDKAFLQEQRQIV